MLSPTILTLAANRHTTCISVCSLGTQFFLEQLAKALASFLARMALVRALRVSCALIVLYQFEKMPVVHKECYATQFFCFHVTKRVRFQHT